MSSFKKGAILELLFALSQSLLAKVAGLLSRVHTHWSNDSPFLFTVLITRRSLVQVQLAPLFSSLSETITYITNFPQKFKQTPSLWGSIGGIANHNSSKILTHGNNLFPFSLSPPFPPILNYNTKNGDKYEWKQRKDFRIDHLLLPSFQIFLYTAVNENNFELPRWHILKNET